MIIESLRSIQVKRQLFLTLLLTVASFLLNCLFISVTVNYLGEEKYGIWATILSVLSWTSILDLGFGKGLRNKLTEALAQGSLNEAKVYISTTYITIAFISIIAGVIIISATPIVDWVALLKVSSMSNNSLIQLVNIITIFTFINFILSTVSQIAGANQQSSISSLIQVFLFTFSLLCLHLFEEIIDKSIINLAFVFGISGLFAYIVASYLFFKNHVQQIPSYKKFSLIKLKAMLPLGLGFFLIQIAVIIIFATDNIIITQVLGPQFVTSYNLVFKMFSVISLGSGILMGPLWSAYTDAFIKGDLAWMKKVIIRLNFIAIPVLLTIILLIFSADNILKFWIGSSVKVDSLLIIYMGLFAFINYWNTLYNSILNGISKIRLSIFIAIVAAILNIPLSVYFAHLIGLPGVILGTIASLSISAIISPLQVYYFIFCSKRNSMLDFLLS